MDDTCVIPGDSGPLWNACESTLSTLECEVLDVDSQNLCICRREISMAARRETSEDVRRLRALIAAESEELSRLEEERIRSEKEWAERRRA